VDPTVGGNIWALSLVVFVCKSFADLYSSYFKWVQTLDAKQAKGVSRATEERVVSLIGSENTLICLAVGCMVVVVSALLLRQELRFPFLTLISLLGSMGTSVIGCLAELRRASLRGT
jgi:hypothetical protein